MRFYMKVFKVEPIEYIEDVDHLEIGFSGELIDNIRKAQEIVLDIDVVCVVIECNDYTLKNELNERSSFREQSIELKVFGDVIYPEIISKHSGDKFECSPIDIGALF